MRADSDLAPGDGAGIHRPGTANGRSDARRSALHPRHRPGGGIAAAFREQMAAGSYLAITHATAGNMSPGDLAQAVQTYASSSAGSITLRSSVQIEALFDGLELEEPGVVPVEQWRPGAHGPGPATYGPTFLGGLARKTANPR
jgi:hypothetical protein